MNCICCEQNSMEVYQKYSYLKLPVYLCKNCQLYVTGTPEKIKNVTESLYKKTYWDERTSEKSIDSDYTDIDSQGKQRRWISQYKYCKPFLSKKKKILEIGSGSGQTLFWFKNLGMDVYGIEPDKRNVELINKKLKINSCKVGFAENFELDQKFDVIWSSHVFEHVLNPKLVLDRLKNFLNENSFLFLEVPNCENSNVLFESINNNPSSFHFSKFSLINIAKNEGYKVVSCDYFRATKLFEGGINKILKKYLSFIKYNPYPHYPKIKSNQKEGTDIRIILKI